MRFFLAALLTVGLASLPFAPVHSRADEVRDDQWHLGSLRTTEAHQLTRGKGVTVAVVDTGVSPHPDLQNNLLNGKDVVTPDGGNGKTDTDGHGTGMAGLIAAHGRPDGDGALGLAPEAEILPVKDSSATDKGSTFSLAAGIQWAASEGADVINVSSSTGPSLELTEALKAAAAADAVVVAGAGNRPDFLQLGYPAAAPGVLAVGATDRDNRHAPFSITGEPIQICAPGVDIVSPRLSNRYSVADGTSSATAIVSGAAALVRAKFPELSAPEVIHRLTATADDIGTPGRDEQCGYGVLNLVAALTADVPPLTPSTPQSNNASPSATDDARDSGVRTPLLLAVALLVVGGLIVMATVRRRRATRASAGRHDVEGGA